MQEYKKASFFIDYYWFALFEACRVILFIIVLRYVGIAGFCGSIKCWALTFAISWLSFSRIYKFIWQYKLWHMLKIVSLPSSIAMIIMAFWLLLYYYGDGGIWQFSKFAAASILAIVLVLSQHFSWWLLKYFN